MAQGLPRRNRAEQIVRTFLAVAVHGRPHFDGAKDEPAVLEVVGEGPAKTTPAT